MSQDKYLGMDAGINRASSAPSTTCRATHRPFHLKTSTQAGVDCHREYYLLWLRKRREIIAQLLNGLSQSCSHKKRRHASNVRRVPSLFVRCFSVSPSVEIQAQCEGGRGGDLGVLAVASGVVVASEVVAGASDSKRMLPLTPLISIGEPPAPRRARMFE